MSDGNKNTPIPSSAANMPTGSILPKKEEIKLDTPVHEEEKVKIINPEDDNDSIVPVQLVKQGIEVVAIRAGFYGQQRIVEGQSFIVKSFESLGEWMICSDKETEKKRKQFFKDKKAGK